MPNEFISIEEYEVSEAIFEIAEKKHLFCSADQ
jgi:hypothetical protein